MLLIPNPYKNVEQCSEAVPATQAAALVASFTKDRHTPTEYLLAMQLLRKARENNLWLTCPCNEHAFLFPRYTPNGDFTVVRTREGHSTECLFGRTKVLSNISETEDYRFLDNTKSVVSFDKMERFAWKIIEASCMTELSSTSLPAVSNIKNVHSSFYDVAGWPGASVTVGELLCVSVKYRVPFFKHLSQLPDWRAGMMRQGFLFTLVTEVLGHSITCIGGRKLEFEKPFDCQSLLLPAWALIVVTESHTGNGFFVPSAMVLYPVYSDRLTLPIHSSQDRDLLRLLLSWRAYWVSKGRDIRIKKIRPIKTGYSDGFDVTCAETSRKLHVNWSKRDTAVSDESVVLLDPSLSPLEQKKLLTKALVWT